jgi:AI-2E family transporter
MSRNSGPAGSPLGSAATGWSPAPGGVPTVHPETADTSAVRAGPGVTRSTARRPPGAAREPVPVRTILASIGLVLGTVLLLLLIREVQRVLVWIVIAGFFAVALYPVVNWIERHVPWCRRSLATLVVYLLLVALIGGLITLFAVPLAREGTTLAHQLPALIEDARAGRGPVGRLLDRAHVLTYLQQNESRIRSFLTGLGGPALSFVKTAATGVAATVTIFVLSFLMVVQGPKLTDSILALFPDDRAGHIRAVSAECAKTITGYVSGNLLISVICGGCKRCGPGADRQSPPGCHEPVGLRQWGCPGPSPRRRADAAGRPRQAGGPFCAGRPNSARSRSPISGTRMWARFRARPNSANRTRYQAIRKAMTPNASPAMTSYTGHRLITWS